MERDFAMAALRIGGWANILIGVGHVLTMVRLRQVLDWVGGPDFDRLSALHPSFPYLLTFMAALAFIGFGLYALSACGDLRPLPFPAIAILAITWIYVVRAVGGAGIGGLHRGSPAAGVRLLLGRAGGGGSLRHRCSGVASGAALTASFDRRLGGRFKLTRTPIRRARRCRQMTRRPR